MKFLLLAFLAATASSFLCPIQSSGVCCMLKNTDGVPADCASSPFASLPFSLLQKTDKHEGGNATVVLSPVGVASPANFLCESVDEIARIERCCEAVSFRYSRRKK
jgi:hypothetical protein